MYRLEQAMIICKFCLWRDHEAVIGFVFVVNLFRMGFTRRDS